VLNIKGRVLPATLAVAQLCARLSDGTLVEGESNISKSAAPIDHVFLDPPHAEPLEEVIAAIRDADAIVLGPGSLYTSILPNLLVQRIAHEIEAANAVKIYVCNVMTQPGETVDYTAAKHVEALIANAKARVCDIVIVNDELPRSCSTSMPKNTSCRSSSTSPARPAARANGARFGYGRNRHRPSRPGETRGGRDRRDRSASRAARVLRQVETGAERSRAQRAAARG